MRREGERDGGGWMPQGPGHKALCEHAEAFGLCPEGKGKLLKGFKPEDDMTRIAVWKDGSGCGVENGLEVRGPGARRNGEEVAGLAWAGVGRQRGPAPPGRGWGGQAKGHSGSMWEGGRDDSGHLGWVGRQQCLRGQKQQHASLTETLGLGQKPLTKEGTTRPRACSPARRMSASSPAYCSDLPSCRPLRGTAVNAQARVGL